MAIFLTTLALFLTALGLHLLMWKVRLPKYHTRTLLILFALVIGAWLAMWPLLSMELSQMLHVCLFYAALSLYYVITYSAIEGDSPTLSLILHLDASGARGISSEEVHEFLEGRPFIKARIAALMHDGLLREENGRYFVAGRGSLFFRLVLAFRRLYGSIERGG
jgi:hypothetical protein